MTTAKLALPELSVNQASKEITVNTAFNIIDLSIDRRVIDKDLATPPGSPANGDAYIVAAGATGAWAGKVGQIAFWITAAGAWQFSVPFKGWKVYVVDEDVNYAYSGTSWGAVAAGGLANLAESKITTAPNATVPAVVLTPSVTEASSDLILSPKGSGAIQVVAADNGTNGGNKRGSYAVDFQRLHSGGAVCVASGSYSVIIGGNGNRSTGNYSISGGMDNTASGLYAVAFGNTCAASGSESGVFSGTQCQVSGNRSAVLGGNTNTVYGDVAAIGSGNSNTIAVGGAGSFIGSGTNNNISAGVYCFIGNGSGNTMNGSAGYAVIGGGKTNNCSGDTCTVGGGQSNTSSATGASVLGGISNTASGSYASVTGGSSNLASGSYSRAGGINSTTRGIYGSDAFSSGAFAAQGDAQIAKYVIRGSTADATAKVLTSDAGAAAVTNTVTLPNASAYRVSGTIVARENATTDAAAWEFKGLIIRGANAAATSLAAAITPTSTAASAGASTWAVAVTANTTIGGLAVTVTGQAAKTIRWVCQVDTVEVVG